MIFTRECNCLQGDISLMMINNHQIEIVHQFKILGAFFDPNFTWKYRINSFTCKVNSPIGILSRASRFMLTEG